MVLRCESGSCSSRRFPCAQGPPQYDFTGKQIQPTHTLQADALCAKEANISEALNVGRTATSTSLGLIGSFATVGDATIQGALGIIELPDGPFQSGLSVGPNTFCSIATDVDLQELPPSTAGKPQGGASLVFWKGAPTDAPDPLAQGGRLDVIFDHPSGPDGFRDTSAAPSSYVTRGAGVYYEVKNADASTFDSSGQLVGMGLSTLITTVPSLSGAPVVTQTLQGARGLYGRRSSPAPSYSAWGAWTGVATWAYP